MQPMNFAPANGGYFGSMMTGNGGLGGNIGSFTSPPVGGDFLDFLKKIAATTGAMGGDQSQSGAPSALPPNSFSPFMPNGGGAPGMQGQGADPLAAIKKAMQSQGGAPGAGTGTGAGAGPAAPPFGSLDPSMLQGILARLGMGGGPGATAGI